MSTSFEVPKRQHPLGVLIIGAQFTWKSVQASWPILIGASFGELQWYHLMVIPAGLVLVGAFALLYYLRFHFYISSDALIVERGIFQRERLQIPFDRIQAVQLFQGPIQQVFGLTGVRVDTAGSSGSELELVAIRKSEASILQKFLNDKMLQATPLEEEHVEHDTDRDEDSRQPLSRSTWLVYSRWASAKTTSKTHSWDWPCSCPCFKGRRSRSHSGWTAFQ